MSRKSNNYVMEEMKNPERCPKCNSANISIKRTVTKSIKIGEIVNSIILIIAFLTALLLWNPVVSIVMFILVVILLTIKTIIIHFTKTEEITCNDCHEVTIKEPKVAKVLVWISVVLNLTVGLVMNIIFMMLIFTSGPRG